MGIDMWTWVKQLFCHHFFYSYVHIDPYYVSVGDEYQDRRSVHYYHICRECSKRIDTVEMWNAEELKTSMKIRKRS